MCGWRNARASCCASTITRLARSLNVSNTPTPSPRQRIRRPQAPTPAGPNCRTGYGDTRAPGSRSASTANSEYRTSGVAGGGNPVGTCLLIGE
ncbi:hypothetical protein GCM10023223_44080 [Stackebrandtia albiflava]